MDCRICNHSDDALACATADQRAHLRGRLERVTDVHRPEPFDYLVYTESCTNNRLAETGPARLVMLFSADAAARSASASTRFGMPPSSRARGLRLAAHMA